LIAVSQSGAALVSWPNNISVYPVELTENEFWEAIRTDDDIEVGHMIHVDANHRWMLVLFHKRSGVPRPFRRQYVTMRPCTDF
jgi:hypothetical protein